MIILVFLVSYTIAASVLLRRPAVAIPGLLGGLFVTLAWLAIQRFTFAGVIAPMTAARQQRDRTAGGSPAGDRDNRMG